MVDTDGQILQHRGVLILRIEFQTRLVVGYEVYLCLYPAQALLVLRTSQEDIVVFVQVELLVADGGALGHQFETDAFCFHLRCGAQTDTHPVLVVVVAQSHQCPVLVQVTVEEGVEHELRILPVVAYLSLIGQAFALLGEVQAEGVDPCTVVDE